MPDFDYSHCTTCAKAEQKKKQLLDASESIFIAADSYDDFCMRCAYSGGCPYNQFKSSDTILQTRCLQGVCLNCKAIVENAILAKYCANCGAKFIK